MKNLKRVLALVIALVFVMGTVAFADTTTTTEEPAAYAKAQDLLGQLNIMVGDENGNFNADKTITKGEAARIIYSLMVEMGGTLPGVDTVFSDVTSLYWGSGYINALNGASVNGAPVINGTGDGTFAPTKALSYDEINTMLAIVLGYQPYAVKQGGYPFGYRSSASKAKLYDNTFGTVTYGGAKEITRGEVAILVANTLIAEVMQPTGYSDDGTNYNFIANSKFAEENCGLKYLEGVVSTSGSNYTVGTSAAMAAGTSKAKDAVGLNAIAFAKGTTLKAVVVTGVRASLASTTNRAKFDLETAGKVKVNGTEYTIADKAKVTVNNVIVTVDQLKEILKDDNSNFKASVYGEAKNVNEIAVELSSVAKITNIYKGTGTIVADVDSKAGTKAAKFFTIADKKDTLTIDGDAATVADAAKDMILKVSPIVANGAITAYSNLTVVDNKLVDVSAMGKNSAGSYYIDGTYYALNKAFAKDADISFGKPGTFTLDFNNKIVAFTPAPEAATDEYLGYITYYGELSGRNDGKITFDMVIDGKTQSFNTTDTVSTEVKNNPSTAEAKTVADVLYKQFHDDQTFDKENVEENRIASIKLDKDSNPTGIKFVAGAKQASAQYSKTYNKIGNVYLSSTSKVYTINAAGKIVEKELSYLSDKATYENVIVLKNYAGKEIGIIIAGNAIAENPVKYALAVDNYTQKYEEDNVLYTYVDVMVAGEAVTLKAKGENLTGIAKGDYFSYKLDANGLATEVTEGKAFKDGFTLDKAAASISVKGTKFSYSEKTSGFAVILAKNGVQLTYTTEDMSNSVAKPEGVTFDLSNNTPVYIYNVATNEVIPSTVEDAIVASEIVEKDGKISAAIYNTMYVNINAKGEIIEIVYYMNL